MVSSLDPTKSKKIFNVGPSTFVTIRNNPTSSPSLLTKTFSNNLAQMDTDDYSDDEIKRRHDNDGLSSLSDQKVVVSVVNDLYKKVVKPTAISSSTTTTTSSSLITSTRKDRARLPVQRELPVKRQHNDASIQTTARATSPPQHQKHRGIRSPIRRTKISTSTTTHDMDEDFDTVEHIESPPPKRTQSHSTQQHQQSSYLVRKTVQQTSNDQSTMKRTMATTVSSATTPTRIGRSTATVEKQNMSTNPNNETIVLVSNLQPTVTEVDVMELFSQAGDISQISVLNRGCIQVFYKNREHAEQACAKYHNRLLDGQFMYVSVQQPDTELVPLLSTKTASTNIGSSLAATTASQSATMTTTMINKHAQGQSQQKDNGMLNQPLKLNASTTSTHSNNNPTSTTVNSKIIIDPTLIRQALFQSSTNSTNPVQFQVKL
ncbi:unnamed protein product [Didymodactylos carnosus]|uniref:RRM domain-containing protein n=1 Tax=Didymodactylos carnosus TaxID=1234261 RepID=A0A8S2FPB6_9BILA|nr:unnamed protein product [Didymodactylos carnosus]CAF4314900.1 unnamed protein product [Didymodactylos carnosus]